MRNWCGIPRSIPIAPSYTSESAIVIFFLGVELESGKGWKRGVGDGSKFFIKVPQPKVAENFAEAVGHVIHYKEPTTEPRIRNRPRI